jgi:hypothetical protein
MWPRDRSAITEPSEFVATLRNDVSQFSELRLPIHLNVDRIAVVFEQWLTPISELLTSQTVQPEISGGFANFFKVGVSKAVSASERIELTPMLRVRLLEEAARKRKRFVDLSSAEPRKAALHSFVGDGRLFFPGQPVKQVADLSLSARAAAALQEERKRWEGIQEQFQRQKGTMVWLASGRRPIASIFGVEWTKPEWLDTNPYPPFGILGLYGNDLDNLVLVTALFIWHQEEDSSPD